MWIDGIEKHNRNIAWSEIGSKLNSDDLKQHYFELKQQDVKLKQQYFELKQQGQKNKKRIQKNHDNKENAVKTEKKKIII